MGSDAPAGDGAALTIRRIDELIPGWRDRLLTADERIVVEQYGGARGAGRRAALVLVDFQHAYLGRDVPVAEQIDEFPAGSGEGAWAALRRAELVLDAARRGGIPVMYTVVSRSTSAKELAFDSKRRRDADLSEGAPGTMIAEAVAPRPEDRQYAKPAASIFFGTDIEAHLRAEGIDTLLLAGLSTGGCVRASVVDAAARGFRAIVIADAAADRLRISHEAALIDIWMKYGDLVLAQDAVRFFELHGSTDAYTTKEGDR